MPLAPVNNININYHVIGKGPPLVLIGGLGVDHNSWIRQIPDLQEYFTLILFDNRGIGKSMGSFGRYTIKHMADDVASLLQYLHIEKAHILGSSMGGLVAQEFTLHYPSMVDKLVLCSTFAKHPEMKTLIIGGIKQLLKSERREVSDLEPHHVMIEKVFTYFFQQIFSEEYIKEHDFLFSQIVHRYLSNPLHGETFLKQLEAIAHHNTTRRLHSITAKTLVIAGDSDKLVPRTCSEFLVSRIQSSRLMIVKNGTHGFHIEQPDLFNQLILSFLLDIPVKDASILQEVLVFD